ncbi:hypothetical protein Tsubulata_012812 [Turnera subulata]|uniref:DUF632 domain-containing protein n=1 Tax=Turnera subulata TaxID=218843 RepID=A0A9Q0J5N2_9ROSI|nr:hypothetical protein Tsubulata_012812 [Turnera subulata]
MGCSTSKLDDEEAVQLCKDRKRFIKQAVEQRTRFASGHLAYIQSLKRVSAALRDYIDGDEPREFLLDTFITPSFTPVKKTSPGFISISPKSFSPAAIQPGPNSSVKVNYLRSGGNQAVSVEERPQSPETIRVEAYSPMHHYGFEGFFAMQSSPMNSSFFSYPPADRPSIPPPSPQTSQWDAFWNPFSSLDYYGYPTRSSLDQMIMDDDMRGLRQVREEEGIPDLEDETEHEMDGKVSETEEQSRVNANYSKEEVLVEDVDEDEEDETDCESECECECEHGGQGLQSQGSGKIELARAQNAGQVKVQNQEMAVDDREAKVETPGFTVYVNRRPTSMAEVIKDLEDQFVAVCNSAKESGEKVRIAYEKKCMQLRNQDVKGEDPFVLDKTRAAIRDLHTQIKVSIHSVEAVSKRIETLRDEELQPQLLELVQGLARMWKVMAECHQSQKHTLDEAKLLLAGTPSKLEARRHSSMYIADPQRLARSAANLETELRNWRACFETWITSQRSYMHALSGWLLRCVRSDPDISRLPFSPRRSSGTFPIFGLCVQWSRFLDSIQEKQVLDGLDFFAAGMGSLYAQQLRDDSRRAPVGSKRFDTGFSAESNGNMELVQASEVEEVMTTEKMAEVAIRVLCAGMSVAMSSLAEFAASSAEGHAELVKQWENANRPQNSSGTGT